MIDFELANKALEVAKAAYNLLDDETRVRVQKVLETIMNAALIYL